MDDDLLNINSSQARVELTACKKTKGCRKLSEHQYWKIRRKKMFQLPAKVEGTIELVTILLANVLHQNLIAGFNFVRSEKQDACITVWVPKYMISYLHEFLLCQNLIVTILHRHLQLQQKAVWWMCKHHTNTVPVVVWLSILIWTKQEEAVPAGTGSYSFPNLSVFFIYF